MPTVNGKKFAYTAKGIKDAEKAAELKKRKEKMETFKKRYNDVQEKLNTRTPRKAVPMPNEGGKSKVTPMPKGLAKPATKGAVRIPKAMAQKPARKGQQPTRAKITKPARKK